MTAAWPMAGHSDAERAFLEARETERLHHAWLIEGPVGIGKSLLVRRLAAVLLGAASVDAPNDDPVIEKIIADSHPDFRWLARRPDEKGKFKQDIPVDDVRGLISFFTLRPALGGWRVGVVDSLDELNRSGANALLKTLEEPPAQAILFLISHGARAVLPTIRSRCRSLRLDRLNEAEMTDAIAALDGDASADAIELANGQPGKAAELTGPGAARAAAAGADLIRSWPDLRDAACGAAINTAGADAVSFEAFKLAILKQLAERATSDPDCAALYLATASRSAEVEDLAMTRAQGAAKIVAELQNAAKAR